KRSTGYACEARSKSRAAFIRVESQSSSRSSDRASSFVSATTGLRNREAMAAKSMGIVFCLGARRSEIGLIDQGPLERRTPGSCSVARGLVGVADTQVVDDWAQVVTVGQFANWELGRCRRRI